MIRTSSFFDLVPMNTYLLGCRADPDWILRKIKEIRIIFSSRTPGWPRGRVGTTSSAESMIAGEGGGGKDLQESPK